MVLVMLAVALIASAQQTAGEYQVKSAYIYNFAKMVQSPAQGLPGSSNLIIGVFGGNENRPL